MNFIECDKIYVNYDTPQEVPAIFFNTYTGVGGAPNVYNTVDMSAYVPEGTKAIHMTGIMIITHGSTPETADLSLFLRTNQNVDNPNYAWQCIEAHLGGGQRSTMATWVALDENRCFQYKYTVTNPNATYPLYSAYAVNTRMDAYAK